MSASRSPPKWTTTTSPRRPRTYDPDGQVVRSTQTVEQNASDTNGAGQRRVRRQRAARCSRTRPAAAAAQIEFRPHAKKPPTTRSPRRRPSTEASRPARVKRMSVAVLVDGTTQPTRRAPTRPRSAQELKQIDALVRSAIGFDAERGDQVQVVNLPFARVDADRRHARADAVPRPRRSATGSRSSKRPSCRSPRCCIGLFVMRPLIARMFAPVASPAASRARSPSGAPAAGQLAAPSAAARRRRARCRPGARA